MDDRAPDHARAADLFREYVERVAAGGEDDLETLCATHPELAKELEERHAEWRALMGLVEAGGDVAPATSGGAEWARFMDRLRERESPWERYQDEGQFATGGVGAIHRVYDRDLQRHLAVKRLLDPAAASARDRLLEEAQVTGQLDHPGIVPVHDVGLDESGRLYFTMKLVRGEDLTHVIEAHHAGQPKWSLPRVLNVMVRVCEALAYAHEKGVVHRDLKPSNLRVGEFGEVYVMDWGLALVRGKREPARDPDAPMERQAGGAARSALLTAEGAAVGTPVYMPPEQASGERDAVAPHSDVYSIGAILYELLAGRPPYVDPEHPTTPWEVVRTVQTRAPDPVGRLARDAPAALLSIVARAMRREPGERYPTVMALAEDLRAFLEERVVSAHDAGALLALRLWARRNQALVAALGLVFVVFVVAAVVSVLFALDAKRETQRAERQTYAGLMLAAEDSIADGRPSAARRALNAAPPDLRGWEWRQLDSRMRTPGWRLPTGNQSIEIAFDEQGEIGVAVGDKSIFTWSVDNGTLRSTREWDGSIFAYPQWSPERGFEILEFGPEQGRMAIRSFDATSGGLGERRLVSQTVSSPQQVRWRSERFLSRDGEGWTLQSAGDDEVLARVSANSGGLGDFTADARWLALPDDSGSVEIFRADGERIARLDVPAPAHTVSFHHRDAWLSASNGSGLVCWWRCRWKNGAGGGPRFERLPLPPAEAHAPSGSRRFSALDPSGRLLVVLEIDGEVLRVYSLPEGRLIKLLPVSPHGTRRLQFSPDGGSLVACARDGALFGWSTASLRSFDRLGSHRSYAYSVRTSPNGERIASCGWDGAPWTAGGAQPGCLRLWDADSGAQLASWQEKQTALAVRWLDDRSLVLLHSNMNENGKRNMLSVFCATDGRVLARRDVGRRMDRSMWIETGDNGKRLAFVSRGRLEILDPESLKPIAESELSAGSNINAVAQCALAYSANGTLLAWSVDREVGVVDAATLEPLWRTELQEREALRLAFSPDGQSLFVAHDGGGFENRSAQNGSLAWEAQGARGRQYAIAVGADGSRIFTGSVGGTVAVFDAADGLLLSVLEGHTNYVYDLDFDAHRGALLSASGDGSIRRWSTQTVTDIARAARTRQATVARIEPEIRALRDELDGDLDALRQRVKQGALGRGFEQRVGLQLVDSWAWASTTERPR